MFNGLYIYNSFLVLNSKHFIVQIITIHPFMHTLIQSEHFSYEGQSKDTLACWWDRTTDLPFEDFLLGLDYGSRRRLDVSAEFHTSMAKLKQGALTLKLFGGYIQPFYKCTSMFRSWKMLKKICNCQNDLLVKELILSNGSRVMLLGWETKIHPPCSTLFTWKENRVKLIEAWRESE